MFADVPEWIWLVLALLGGVWLVLGWLVRRADGKVAATVKVAVSIGCVVAALAGAPGAWSPAIVFGLIAGYGYFGIRWDGRAAKSES